MLETLYSIQSVVSRSLDLEEIFNAWTFLKDFLLNSKKRQSRERWEKGFLEL